MWPTHWNAHLDVYQIVHYTVHWNVHCYTKFYTIHWMYIECIGIYPMVNNGLYIIWYMGLYTMLCFRCTLNTLGVYYTLDCTLYTDIHWMLNGFTMDCKETETSASLFSGTSWTHILWTYMCKMPSSNDFSFFWFFLEFYVYISPFWTSRYQKSLKVKLITFY